METLSQKDYEYLLYLSDRPEEKHFYKFLSNCKFEEFDSTYFTSTDTTSHDLNISVAPEIFKDYQDYLNSYKTLLRDKIRITFNLNIANVHFKPNLQNFHVFGNKFVPQPTRWKEINNDQNHLLTSLQKAQTIFDYQNVGNTARTILKKITNLVFDNNKHIKEGIDLAADKYKNRLHTYIEIELQGSENKDFRQFAESLIKSCEKAIDLSNTLTHDLNATAFMAESSVIGVLTIINIIRLIGSRISSPVTGV